MKEGYIGFSSQIVVIDGKKCTHTNIELGGANRADVAMLILELEIIRTRIIKAVEQQKPLVGVKKS